MPHIIDRLYFTRRAEQSLTAMAAAAEGSGARAAHGVLSQAYAMLAAPSPEAPSDGREALACWADEGGFPR